MNNGHPLCHHTTGAMPCPRKVLRGTTLSTPPAGLAGTAGKPWVSFDALEGLVCWGGVKGEAIWELGRTRNP